MSILVLIPARMASTRLPGKPLAEIAGRPMILHVAARAREAGIGRVVVATDTPEVAHVVEAAGFPGAATHLATGNLRIDSSRRSSSAVERDLEGLLAAEFGFEVPTIVLTPSDLRLVVEEVDRVVPPVRRTYVTLLKQEPPQDVARELDSWSVPGEGARVAHRSVL